MALPSTTTFNTGTAQANDPRMSTPGRTYEGNINIPGSVTSPDAPVIPLGTVNSGVQPLNLPPTPVNTTNQNLTSTAFGSVTQPPSQQPQQDTGVYKPTGDWKKDMFGQLDSLSTRNSYLTDESGIGKAGEEVQSIKNEMASVEHEYRREEESTNTNSLLNNATRQARLGEIGRKKASQLADLAIVYNAKLGNYEQIEKILDKKIEAETYVSKAKADFFGYMYKTTQEQSYQRQEKRAQWEHDKEVQTLRDFNEAKKLAYQNGEISLNDFVNIKNPADLKAMAPQSDAFAATLQGVARLESATVQPKVLKDLRNYIATGDYTSAYNQIGNSVSNGLTGENKTKFDAARSDIQIMAGLKDAIKKYQDAGGDTSLLKGKAQDISQKLGKVKDPALAQLATQLDREFQMYRSNMSGAAFSPAESREYAAVNPTTGKTMDLNYAVIQGALNQLNNRVDGTIISKAGEGAKYIKEYAMGAGQVSEQDAQQRLIQFGSTSPKNMQVIQQITTSLPNATAAELLRAFPEYFK